MEATDQTIAGMSHQELRAFVAKQLDDLKPAGIAGLSDLINAAAPPGSLRLSASAAPEPGCLLMDGASHPKVNYPNLDAVLATAGYPWGSTATDFTLVNLSGTEPDPALTWQVKV